MPFVSNTGRRLRRCLNRKHIAYFTNVILHALKHSEEKKFLRVITIPANIKVNTKERKQI